MPRLDARLGAGIGFALAAGLAWGLVFVAPVLLPDYSPAMLTFGRYLAFGLIALPLAWWDRAQLSRLTREDWIEALKLSVVGNLLYYLFLAASIQRAGGPLPTMIIGTLPVVIAIVSNLRGSQVVRLRDGRLPWRRLAPWCGWRSAGWWCWPRWASICIGVRRLRPWGCGWNCTAGAGFPPPCLGLARC
jgi:drug/metabolite transporter (DMT)-like permease